MAGETLFAGNCYLCHQYSRYCSQVGVKISGRAEREP